MLANNKAVAAVNVTPPITAIILPTKVIFYMLVATTDSVLFVLSINIKKKCRGCIYVAYRNTYKLCLMAFTIAYLITEMQIAKFR
jgi:hypothetical protein